MIRERAESRGVATISETFSTPAKPRFPTRFRMKVLGFKSCISETMVDILMKVVDVPKVEVKPEMKVIDTIKKIIKKNSIKKSNKSSKRVR